MRTFLQIIVSLAAALFVNSLFFEYDPNSDIAGYGETVLFIITAFGTYFLINTILIAIYSNNKK